MKAGGGENCRDCWNFFRLSCFFFKGEVSGGWVLEAGNIAMELVSQTFPRDHFGPDRHSRATPALIWKQIDLTCVCLILSLCMHGGGVHRKKKWKVSPSISIQSSLT